MSRLLWARRAFAVLAVAGCASVAMPLAAAVTLLGTIATQPRVPAKIAACDISVASDSFAPTVTFAQQPNPVARYTVTLAFFDKKNLSVGRVDITDHGSDTYPLPARADSMTCAISRLTLDDGSTYPNSGGGNAAAGGIALGVLGAGALLGLALGTHHGSGTGAATSAPTANPTATGTATATATATSSATAVGATPTATATSTASASPTPSPFPTSPTTPIPSARPQAAGPRLR